ncbi:hypothetical protein [Olsenella sp. An188]|uniref:hypothetical protein n=1 Tax=Olsenella sp. An188 TaxID=1965579 RepID=UPI000B3748AD|nr:hypothetical protein [Olsenella sp. An188]OUP37952.1 hypothetical protein B5F23_08325 [Olsenella sp. An188]
MSRGPLSKEDWKMGYSEASPPTGCSAGCLLLAVLCVAFDAVVVWAVWQLARGLAWIVSLIAYA